ncbi:MAG TPA: WD40 repeat domain-containing protein [Chthonomonadaceae bacterium]|nr:WD40 repeat domain-containing protein [Chthonomonadaceae bacterium]
MERKAAKERKFEVGVVVALVAQIILIGCYFNRQIGASRWLQRPAGSPIKKFQGHTKTVYVAFSPDGQILATASHDATIKLWSVPTGKTLRTLTGHTDAIWIVAFSPDGKFLATGSLDDTARLWEVSTGKCLHTLRGHTLSVHSVAFSPDGKLLATGSYDDAIRLWDVATGKVVHNPSCYLGTRLRENRSGNRLLHHRLPSRRGKVAT